MANVKFSRKEFESYIKLTKEIEEKISMFGTPLESATNDEIEIEIFPNRPDLLSLQGYMRSFLAFLGKKTGLKEYKINPPEKDYEVTIESSVNKVRPFTACAIVKSLVFDNEKIKEIIDIQEKLHTTIGRSRKKIAIGIYPLEKITLPITYKALEPEKIKFNPLESDKEMTGMQILKQHPTGREYADLLKDEEKFPIFVDASGEILSMPPIINSQKTGKIDEETKEVFVECSGFSLEILKKVLNIIITTLADMGGKVYQMNLKYKKPQIIPELTPEKLKINIQDAEKLLGINLQEKEVKKLLEKMGYNYKNSEVEIPSWRVDILHPVDIYEDIAIAYGYENLIPKLPEIFTIGEENKTEILKRKITEILSGLNFLEISSYHLLTKQDLKKSNIKLEIEVEKSKTDYTILRSQLLTSMLKILGENIDSEYPQKLFELGRIFKFEENSNTETKIKEQDNLILASCPGNFTEIKQDLEYLGKMLNIGFTIKESVYPGFIEGRTGKIFLNSKEIGVIGEIHPTLLKNFHLKLPLTLFEISLEEVFELLT